MGTVKQVFTGDASQLESAYTKLASAQDRLEAKMQKLAEASQAGTAGAARGQSQQNSLVAAGVSQVAQLAASWLTVSTVIGAAQKEMTSFEEMQKRAAAVQSDVGVAQSKLNFNLATVKPEEREYFYAEMRKIAKDNTIGDVRSLFDTANKAFASTDSDLQKTLEAVRAAAPLGRNAPQEMGSIAAGAAMISKMAGVSMEEALALQAGIGSESKIDDPAQQSRYIPSAIEGVLGTLPESAKDTDAERRQNVKDIGAFVGAMGSAGGDTEGTATQTEVVDFAIRMRDYFTKGVQYTIPGWSGTLTHKPKEDPESFHGRIKYLQENEKERQRFLESVGDSGSTKFRIAREQVLDKGGTTAKRLEEIRGRVGYDTAVYDNLKASQTDGTPEVMAANRKAELDGLTQRWALRQQLDGVHADSRALRDKVLAETRPYAGDQWGDFMIDSLRTSGVKEFVTGNYDDTIDDALVDMKRRQADLLAKKDSWGYRGFGTRSPDALSPDERAAFDKTEEGIATLEGFKRDKQKLELQLNEPRQQVRESVQPNPTQSLDAVPDRPPLERALNLEQHFPRRSSRDDSANNERSGYSFSEEQVPLLGKIMKEQQSYLQQQAGNGEQLQRDQLEVLKEIRNATIGQERPSADPRREIGSHSER